MEQQLLTYIGQELRRGVPVPMIKKALKDAGWESDLVQEALDEVESQVVPPDPLAQIVRQDEKENDVADDGDQGATRPKAKRPLLAASLVLVAIIALAAGMVVYFNFSKSWQSAVDTGGLMPEPEVAETNGEVPPPGVMVVDPAESDLSTTAPVLGNATATTEIAGAATTTIQATTTPAVSTAAQERDTQRISNLRQLASAQETWFKEHNKYYTCGLAAGDCGGKPRAYPAQIGNLTAMPQDPSGAGQGVCGSDYVYCGLNNAPYPQFFCYYAKLEGGGYYTASHNGNFKRSTPPKIFEECAMTN